MSQLLNALKQGRRDDGGGFWPWGLPSAPTPVSRGARLMLLVLLFFAGAGAAALGWQLWQQVAGGGGTQEDAVNGAESVGQLMPSKVDAEALDLVEQQLPDAPQGSGVYRLAPLHWVLRPLPPVAKAPTGAAAPHQLAAQEPAGQQPSAVSAKLAAAFQQAVAAVPGGQTQAGATTGWDNNPPALPLAELPDALRGQVPPMSFSSHVYSSTPANRLVRVNGKELHEGDWLTTLVQLVEIRQDQVIMRVEGQSFSLPALAEWN